jgi:hypothetical protein
VNRFIYIGAGPYVLNYDHVEVFSQNAGWKTAQIMDEEEQILDDKLRWGPNVDPLELERAFTITILYDYPTQIPEIGWQWIHGAHRGGNLGTWKILRNGVELNHTTMVDLGEGPVTLRTINEV